MEHFYTGTSEQIIAGNPVKITMPGSQLDGLVGTVRDATKFLVEVCLRDGCGHLEFYPDELVKIHQRVCW